MSLDHAFADHVTPLTLVGAQISQQLNAAVARNQVQSQASVLTLSVQLTHLATLNRIYSLSPMHASIAANLQDAELPSRIAGLQAAHRTPQGQGG